MSEAEIKSLSEDIQQLTTDNTAGIVTINEKKEKNDNQQKTLLCMKTELEVKKNILKEKEEKVCTRCNCNIKL